MNSLSVDSIFTSFVGDTDRDDTRSWALLLAGGSVLLACCLTAFLIGEHLTAYNKPEEQKWIIGCIFMVPLYSVCSFLSLWQPRLDTVSNLVRNVYEAYTLYSFGMFLIACMGGEERTIEKLSGRSRLPSSNSPLLDGQKHPPGYTRVKEELRHPIPMNLFLKPWVPGPEFYTITKFGVVQYLCLDPWRLYGEGDFDWGTGYPYMTIVLNFSQCWAIYCLVMFYHASWQYLTPIKPLGKFISIKSIVFVTWWQGVIIALAFAFKVLKAPPGDDITQGLLIQNAMQDFLVALEMSVAAIAHIYCFPAEPYQHLVRHEAFASQYVAVLENMADLDVAVDPEEVIASEAVGQESFLPLASGRQAYTNLAAAIQDVLFVGGKEVVVDVKKSVHVAVEPLNSAFQGTLDAVGNLRWGGLRKPRGNQEVRDDSYLSTKRGRWARSGSGVGHEAGVERLFAGEGRGPGGLAPRAQSSDTVGIANPNRNKVGGLGDSAGRLA